MNGVRDRIRFGASAALAALVATALIRTDAPAQQGGEDLPRPPYRIEEIPTPPGQVPETGGIDFLPDGRVVAVFHHGEILIYDPKSSEWSVFATGLHDPLGVVVINEREMIVGQRPEVTRVVDTDGDGKADLFETISDEFGMSGNYSEFLHG